MLGSPWIRRTDVPEQVVGVNRPTKEKNELLENDFMHYENKVYPHEAGKFPTLAEAFAAGWRARDNREGPIETGKAFPA